MIWEPGYDGAMVVRGYTFCASVACVCSCWGSACLDSLQVWRTTVPAGHDINQTSISTKTEVEVLGMFSVKVLIAMKYCQSRSTKLAQVETRQAGLLWSNLARGFTCPEGRTPRSAMAHLHRAIPDPFCGEPRPASDQAYMYSQPATNAAPSARSPSLIAAQATGSRPCQAAALAKCENALLIRTLQPAFRSQGYAFSIVACAGTSLAPPPSLMHLRNEKPQ